MKVEYLLKLFNHFNKQIWTNKIFSYFLIAIIIGYTIALRPHPDIYYKYIYNPLILIILIFSIILIAKYNIPLGFMLTFSLLALYFPKHSSKEIEEGFETVKTPIYGEDKNIVDDEKKSKDNKTTKSNKKEEETEEESEEKEEEKGEKREKEEKKDTKKKNDEDADEDEVKDIGLEKLNPGYYKNKNSTNNKTSEKKTETDTTTKKEQGSLPKSKDSETFLGDVRQVIKDLDTGRGGMNASNAIKSINNLFYNKHKTNIKKIIEEDDEESEDDDDEDFF